MNERENCPRKDKVAFPSYHAAEQHAAQYRMVTPELRVYLCDCGAWHVGRPVRHEPLSKRLARALHQGNEAHVSGRLRYERQRG